MMHVRETPLAVLLMFMHVNSSLACIDKNSSILNPREFADQLLWFAKNNDVHCLSEALAATPASQQTIQFIFNNAVENDAAAVIEYLFESGYAQNAWKTTALFTAAKLCKPRAFEILLRHGADTRNTSDPIQTATHYAAISTCEASSTIIELILSRTNNQTEDKDDQGCTPLIAAAVCGNVYALQTLLRHGANTEAVCKGRTALFYAVASDALNADAAVELLLEHGANVHVRDSLDVTPLTHGILRNNKHVVEQLLRHGANVNEMNNGNRTALLFAIVTGNADMFDYLIANGADPFVQDKSGQRLTHIAAAFDVGESDVMMELILTHTRNQTEDKNDIGCTPLITAARHGNVHALHTLLRHGANTEAVCKGVTALLFAVTSHARNASAAVELLLQYGANLHVRDPLDATPLTHAIFQYNKHVVEQLLKHGANINEVNVNRTALLFAAAIGNADMFDYLIKNGADPFARDGSGLGVAHYAALSQSIESGKIIEIFLLQTNNQTEVKDVEGCTPLLVAASQGNVYAVQALLEHGALTEAICDGNKTALMFAAKSDTENASAVAEMLLQHGADLNAKDETNLTPAMIAVMMKNKDMIILLQKHQVKMNDGDTFHRTELPGGAPIGISLGFGALLVVLFLLALGLRKRYIRKKIELHVCQNWQHDDGSMIAESLFGSHVTLTYEESVSVGDCGSNLETHCMAIMD